MGLVKSTIGSVLNSSTPAGKILILGLDGAGKTTILYWLKLKEVLTVIPTEGFNVETVTPIRGVHFTFWDIGGRALSRPWWNLYIQDTTAVIFVVDSVAEDRMDEAREELMKLDSDAQLQGVPFLVLANKQEHIEAMRAQEVAERLYMYSLKDRHWHVQGTSVYTGEGLIEALKELKYMLNQRRSPN